jgi:hypothetical protein
MSMGDTDEDDNLPRGVQVGARLERQVDHGQAGHRRRVDAVQPRHAVEQVLLEPQRDQLLHLGRRQPERLGLDFHRRRHELRVDVDGGGAELGDPDDRQPDDERDDETPEPEARTKDPAHVDLLHRSHCDER